MKAYIVLNGPYVAGAVVIAQMYGTLIHIF